MSPIESWEGVEAYFTGADSGFFTGFFLIAAVVLCVIPIIECAVHENKIYKKVANGGK
jgi:hypothetical protein